MMKFIKWKSLVITCIVCLFPMFLGIALWNDLPDSIAIHFNFYNEPDNFASKEFAVFGLPALMVLLQIYSCFINDLNAHKHGQRIKFEKATKWIIPAMTVLLQIITLGYSLGWNIDIRKVVILIISGVFLVIGNYLPKFDYATVIMGVLMLITMFLPPIATIIWMVLLIPYTVIGIIYGIRVGRKG